MLSNFAKELLGQMKKDSARRSAQKSADWLRNKILRDTTKVKVSKPSIGRMYLFVYDAKYKATLPYWDVNPMIIMIGPAKGGFYGINFHYLNLNDRMELLEMLVPFQKLVSAKTQQKININYAKLLKLSKTTWKHCFKHYLINHVNTKLVEIPMEEWVNTLMLPLAHFKGATSQQVWRDK